MMDLVQFFLVLGITFIGENVVSYEFKYSINKYGVTIQQHEMKRADHAMGSYSVLQPDGKIRDVRYNVVGNGGYRAVVDYRIANKMFMGHLKYPRDFQHPVVGIKPVSTIPRELLGHSDKHEKNKH